VAYDLLTAFVIGGTLGALRDIVAIVEDGHA
jgi:hypothetical protein